MYKKKSPDLHRLAKPASLACQQTSCRSRFAFKRTLSVACVEPGARHSGFASRCKAGALLLCTTQAGACAERGEFSDHRQYRITGKTLCLFRENSSVTGNEFRVSTLRKAQYPPENFSEQTQGFAGDPSFLLPVSRIFHLHSVSLQKFLKIE
jgi:hypothetical protein